MILVISCPITTCINIVMGTDPEKSHGHCLRHRNQREYIRTPGWSIIKSIRQIYIESSIDENSAFKSKPYIASEFEPSSDLGMSDQVILSESSAPSPAEEERCVAWIIPEHEAVMPALTDAKSMLRVMSHDHQYETVERSVNWDSKTSSTLSIYLRTLLRT